MMKPNVKKIVTWRSLLVFILLSVARLADADQLTASVDRDSVSIQETFILTVAADSRVKNKPDFSTLKNDFDILSNNESQFTSITSSGAEFKKTWQLTLAPKKVGTLLIPSFSVDNSVSDAIEIKVTQQSQTQVSGDDPVRVAIEVDKNNVFVQEQILVKIQIISKVNLNQTELQALQVKNAVVIPLEEKPTRFISTINGKQHLVEEQNFAIFPQGSGELVIPSLTYSVVPNVERDFWNDPFGRNRSNILRLPTEEQHITVKPIPAAASGKAWQPAKNLTLNESWSSSLDHLKMGEPVTRTLTISAEGLTGGQISPLTMDSIEGMTLYPDQPQNNDSKSAKGVQGTRIETTAIIPNHGGEFTLPEVKVDWWDINSQSMKTATLPAKKISVLGDSATNTNPPTNIPNSTATDNNPIVVQTDSAQVISKPAQWIIAIAIFFAVLSVGLLAYIFHLRSIIKTLRNQQAESDDVVSEKEKHTWDLLKQSAANRDPQTLRKNIIGWAKLQWPDSSIHSLDDVAKLGTKIELTLALKTLDEVLYSNHPEDSWDPHQLLHLLTECRKDKNTRKKNESLKPLYNS